MCPICNFDCGYVEYERHTEYERYKEMLYCVTTRKEYSAIPIVKGRFVVGHSYI